MSNLTSSWNILFGSSTTNVTSTEVDVLASTSYNIFIDPILTLCIAFLIMFVIFMIVKFFIEFIRELKYECSNCNEDFMWKDTIKYNKKVYCKECYKKKFNVCDGCNKVYNEILTKYKRYKMCTNCLETKIIKCPGCKKKFGKWEMKNGYCKPCYDNKFRTFRVINFRHIKLKSQTFVKNKYKRYCGIEIECKVRNRDKSCFVKNELKNLKFSQIRDSSIGIGGIEFVSKPMNGDLLFKKIDNLCDILNKKNYYVNTRCGLHIHLGVIKRLELLKNIYIFYNKFEKFFFDMVPKSRQNTSFCEKFKKIYKHNNDKIFKVNSLKLFKQLIYETKDDRTIERKSKSKWDSKRYCWINFHSIFYRGTLEIRNHAGTISKNKIKRWLLLHLTILNYLNKVDTTTINNLENDKETFLSLFDKNLQKYIKKRWEKFKHGNKIEESRCIKSSSESMEELFESLE